MTLEWEPESALSEHLFLVLDVPGGPSVSTSGTSPLVLQVENLAVSGDLRTRVFADYMGGVALEQAFDITLDVVYND